MKALEKLVQKPISGEWGKEGNKVKVLRTTNFTNQGVIDYGDVVTRDISEKKIEQKKLINGDVIIEKSGGSPTQPVGRVVYFDSDEIFLCNNFTSILRPKKEIVFPKYLHYLLFANHSFGVVSYFQNKTTGIINLQLPRYLKEAKIPLPPLPVQEKIASILDDAAALRDKTEQLLIEYDLLAQSIFLEMFGDPVINRKGWEEERLKNLGTLKSGGTPSRKKEGYFKGDIPWITTVALGERMIGYNNAVEYITKEAINNSATKLIPKGSIMIGVRVGVGKASLIECDMCSNQDIISLIDIDKKINKIFLLDVLFYFQKYFDSQKRGATIQGIKSSTIKELSVIVPPLNLQNQFAEKVQLIERQKEIVRQELKESEDLFQALLQKAFKGELV